MPDPGFHPRSGRFKEAYNVVPPRNVDVVIVGGGFSGIQAAWDCHKAGLNCVVLEAKHRIGGRSRTHQLQSGPGVVELGATWINDKTQPKIYATTKRLGLEMSEQYVKGDSVFQLRDGTIMRVGPDSPEGATLDQTLEKFYQIFDSAVETIDIHNPTQFPQEDDVSLAEWLKSQGLDHDPLMEELIRIHIVAFVGRETSEMGAHYMLDYIKSGHGLAHLALDTADGAQYLKIKKGTSAIVQGLADELHSGSIMLNAPVNSISQSAEAVLVQTATDHGFFAKKVILAIPTNTYEKITFSPPLPADKKHIVSRTKPGLYQKPVLTYRKPWWRELGFDGKFTSFKGPIDFTFDIVNSNLQQHSLALFITAENAVKWSRLN